VDAVLWRLGIPAPLIHGSFWALWHPFLAVDLDLARAKILCAPAIRCTARRVLGRRKGSFGEIETLVCVNNPRVSILRSVGAPVIRELVLDDDVLKDLREVTGRLMIRTRSHDQRGLLVGTDLLRLPTPGPEMAPGRGICWAGRVPGEDDLPTFASD
jgi:hypothetical protein